MAFDQAAADESYGERLKAFEDEASQNLAGPVLAALTDAARKCTALWVKAFGGVDVVPDDPAKLADVLAQYAVLLQGLPLDLEQGLLDAAAGGRGLGVGHAADVLKAHRQTPPRVGNRVSQHAQSNAANAGTYAGERIQKTIGLAKDAKDYGDLVKVFADSRVAVSLVNRAVVAAVFGEAAVGVQAVTDRAHVGRVWVAERDACVHCAGHAGAVAEPGKLYPPLTYGTGANPFGAVARPPLHPHCRCVCTPWSDNWHPAGSTVPTYPETLRREAKRSILQGRRLESESHTVRLRTAKALLAKPGALDRAPASVIRQARVAVKTGKFAPRPDPRRAAENRAARDRRKGGP